MEHSMHLHNEAWGVNPRLDMPDLFPPAVMFSIHDRDPHVKYKTALQKLSEAKEHGRLEPLPPVTSSMMHQLMLRSAWDSVFHDVPGDRMGLLYQNTDQPARANAEGSMVHAVIITSTEPAGKRWVVTRATEFRGKSVCWCVPVEVEPGQRSEVVLTSENMIILESAERRLVGS